METEGGDAIGEALLPPNGPAGEAAEGGKLDGVTVALGGENMMGSSTRRGRNRNKFSFLLESSG